MGLLCSYAASVSTHNPTAPEPPNKARASNFASTIGVASFICLLNRTLYPMLLRWDEETYCNINTSTRPSAIPSLPPEPTIKEAEAEAETAQVSDTTMAATHPVRLVIPCHPSLLQMVSVPCFCPTLQSMLITSRMSRDLGYRASTRTTSAARYPVWR